MERILVTLPIILPVLVVVWAVRNLHAHDALPARTDASGPALRRTLVVLDAVIAANAFAGSWYGIFGAPAVPREWLDGTPFETYLVPSLILGYVVGNVHLFAAVFVARRLRFARHMARAAAAILAIWIGVQVVLIGWVSWLQPAMLGAALVCAALALTVPQGLPSRDAGAAMQRSTRADSRRVPDDR